jgi:hypothetical protein
MTRHLILLTSLVLTGCVHCGPAEPETPPAETPADCAAACDNLRKLSCPEGDSAPESGASCEDVCNNTAEYGISLDTACVIKMTTCAQIENCAGD